ncbi:MAG: EVE domain-containing protein [Proteobacteria bacterium]|nr:EVE domain-containing protein [Pseudomonadota bacterium]
MKYWLVVTSADNFKHDQEHIGFKFQGIPIRFKRQVQKMDINDKVIYYIMGLQKFGAIARITGEYYEDHSKVWIDDEEMWPARRPSEPEIVLQDDELIDAKRLVPDLSFIKKKEFWGVYFQGSIREIPEEDFCLIESEMRKIMAERKIVQEQPDKIVRKKKIGEDGYQKLILGLPLNSKSLHDRLAEMLEQIGSWMDFNTQTKYKISPDHSYQLDVAWLRGKNPEVAVEIQISGNITEAKDRLAQARKFNYRKVVIVLMENDLKRLNSLMKYEPDLRSWMEAWSIGAVYEMWTLGKGFFKYYLQLIEAVYKDKKELELVL